MNLKMLIQVGLLGKSVHATWVRTLEWTLPCVNAKVVEEIVPFSENTWISALWVVALEYLYSPLGFRVCV